MIRVDWAMRSRVVSIAALLVACRPPAAEPLPAMPPPIAHRPAPPPQTPPRHLTVHVLDENAQPVAGAAVYAVVQGGGEAMPLPYHSEPATTDSAGSADLTYRGEVQAIVATRDGWPAQAVVPSASTTIVLGPARAIAGHVAITGCPGGGLELRVRTRTSELEKGLVPPPVPIALDGSFTIAGLGPGEYNAQVYACGRAAGARFTGRDKQLDLKLPDRPAEQPLDMPITVTTTPPSSRCRFQPWTTPRLVAGDFSAVFLDDRCRLFVRGRDGWSIVSATGAIPLGDAPGRFPIGRSYAALPGPGGHTWIVALATGKTETLNGDYEVAFAPHDDTFALRKRLRSEEPLELRFADGTQRRVSSQVLEAAWIDDGRLAYLEHTPGHLPAHLHVYDPVDGRDRDLGTATHFWAGANLIVLRDAGVLVSIDLRTYAERVLGDRIYRVHVVGGAALYEGLRDNHVRSWLWNAGSDTVTDVSDVIGSNIYDLRIGPRGELVLVGRDVAVAAAGRLRVVCEASRVLDIAGDTVLCSENEHRTIAAALDGSRRVALALTGAEGRWAPDRDTFYVLDYKGLVATDATTGRSHQVAHAAQAFFPIDSGRVLYAVPGDGVYVAGP